MGEGDINMMDYGLLILYGFAMDFLFPNRFLLKLFAFLTCSPTAVARILAGLVSGYVDVLYMNEEYHRSLASISAYVGALLLRPVVLTFWAVVAALVLFIWAHVTVV